MRLSKITPLVTLLASIGPLVAADIIETEICIFGGTSGGIAAAVQAARMGKTVVIAESSQHLGGLTTGGLGATDIGSKSAIGGIAREFYEQIATHYSKPDAWKWEQPKASATLGTGQERGADPLVAKTGRLTKWTFEPHVATRIYQQMLQTAKVPVYLGQRLATVKKEKGRLVEIAMNNGRIFRAKMFIDGTYEGDLMAKAGVSYHVGREANSVYDETLNGVRAETPKHQFLVEVDPYVQPGKPASGLLPFIQGGDGGHAGAGDKAVQAYNFRLCMTRTAANQVPWEKPKQYNEKKYELLARLIETHVKAGKPLSVRALMNPVMMPNDKTDTNNNGPFSTDFIGANYDYPEGNYETRDRIWAEHENYIRGFLYFLSTSERVPKELRDEMNSWGLAQDEFLGTAHFPPQMYVREARRMISDYVMTEHDCRWKKKAEDPVGLGAYNMDSHNCQRLVKNGVVRNEGDVQVGVSPYGISYRSIVPKQSQCENLFVPVALAASHIAYGSIRMEPVFMILGQSSATAAAMAIDAKIPVQKVAYAKLKERLMADGQILEWSGPGRVSANNYDPKEFPGIVMDNEQAERLGHWSESSAARSLGHGYLHDGNTEKGKSSVTFRPDIKVAGEYEIFLLYPPLANRASNVPVTITIANKDAQTVKVNQKNAGKNNAYSLGRFRLAAGQSVSIMVSNSETDGYVIADGLQLVPASATR